MNLVEQLVETRKFAGLPNFTNEQLVDLAEKKLTGAAKEEFLAKMSGKKVKKVKKDDDDDGVDGVDGSGEEASKGAKKAMDKASIKGSVSGEKGVKMKKKVSEQLNAVLEGAGLTALSEDDAAKIDATYPA